MPVLTGEYTEITWNEGQGFSAYFTPTWNLETNNNWNRYQMINVQQLDLETFLAVWVQIFKFVLGACPTVGSVNSRGKIYLYIQFEAKRLTSNIDVINLPNPPVSCPTVASVVCPHWQCSLHNGTEAIVLETTEWGNTIQQYWTGTPERECSITITVYLK